MGNDGPRTPTEIEKLDHLIEIELREWARVGISPDGISPILFNLMMQVLTSEQMLVEKGICTQEELDIKYKENYLERLTKEREQLEPQIEAWKAQQRQEALKATLDQVPKFPDILRP